MIIKERLDSIKNVKVETEEVVVKLQNTTDNEANRILEVSKELLAFSLIYQEELITFSAQHNEATYREFVEQLGEMDEQFHQLLQGYVFLSSSFRSTESLE